MIVIGRLAAHIDHAVDCGTAAQNLAPRIVEGAPVQARLGHRLEAPIRSWIALGIEIADGNMEPDPVILAACFEEQHFGLGIGA